MTVADGSASARETPVDRATAASAVSIAAELRRQAASLLATADRIDPHQSAEAWGPVVPSQGVALVARERLRQIEGEGHDPAGDHVYVGNELAWAAYCYLERAAQDRLPQGDSSVPHVWPLARSGWKPKESRVRNLVVAAALVVAEIDRLLARGETP